MNVSVEADVGFGELLAGSGGGQNALRLGASCQLPLKVSMENTDPHHLQGGSNNIDYSCGFPTPTP